MCEHVIIMRQTQLTQVAFLTSWRACIELLHRAFFIAKLNLYCQLLLSILFLVWYHRQEKHEVSATISVNKDEYIIL